MTQTTSSRIVMRGIVCTLILLLELSAQAIDYEIYIHDATPTKLRNDVALTNRDFLERFDFITSKTSYSLQEGTEHWLRFGAFLRARVLDTFGNLLYIHYDDFSTADVDALRKVYRTILERRYRVFDLVPDILRDPDTRPSRICAATYAYADSCLRNSASVCHRIGKHHDRSRSDDLNTTVLNVMRSVYRSSRMSKYYPGGFSPSAVLKLLQRGMLTITPNLLTGLLFNARYDSFDDDIRLAERELVRYFNQVQRSDGQGFTATWKPLPFRELKKFRSADSFLKYYIDVRADGFPNDNLRRHTSLIAKHIVGDVGTIDENIHLLGNVYENGTIHVGYLFDLVLPDDVLNEDVVEAKRYLARKLDETDAVGKYLDVQKYQQATPAELATEITGQLRDIGFAQDIATALRMHARFWRRSRMIESLDELLVLFDAYENLRRVPRYRDMMERIDRIRKSLWDTRHVPVEILCNAPRACLRIGLQTVLQCRFVNPEIKALIRDFLKQVTSKGALLSDECLVVAQTVKESRRAVDISFKLAKMRLSIAKTTKSYPEVEKKMPTVDIEWISGMRRTETTPRLGTTEQNDRDVTTEAWKTYESKETAETVRASSESTEELPAEPKTFSEDSVEYASTTAITPKMTDERIEHEGTTELTTNTGTYREETTAATTSAVAETTTVGQATTTAATTKLPTTTTTSPTTTTESPATTTASPTTTTESPATTTASPTTTTESPTTTTASPTTTTESLATTTASPTATTESPTTTTTSPTTTAFPATTTASSITTVPTSTTSRMTTTTASRETTTAESLTTSTATMPTTIVSTSPATTIAASSAITEKMSNIDVEMGSKRSETFTIEPVLDDENLRTKVTESPTTTFVTTTTPRTHESDESNSERGSEETAEYETSTALTLKTQAPISMVTENVISTTSTMQASTFVETTDAASSELSSTRRPITNEMTTATTESSKTPVTEAEVCAESSCLEERASESTEEPRCAATDCSGKSCSETDCDSLMTDCDDDDNDDIAERSENCTAKCSRTRCEKDSPEASSECETGSSGRSSCEDSECASNDDEGSAECVKLCITRERSTSCGNQDDCTRSARRPTIDVKFERARNRTMCEIRDPHHRRQLRRLAKMRAISAATSRVDDAIGSRTPRIATKKLYDLLVTGLPRFKKERSRKRTGYLLKKSLGTMSSSVEAAGGKRRRQRNQFYRLRKGSARRIGRKSTDGRSKYRSGRTPVRQSQNERISIRRGAKSIGAARERAIGDWNASI